MGKPGLVKIDKGAIVKTQPTQPVHTGKTTETTEQSNAFKDILLKHSSELISIVSDVIHGNIEIAKMRADTDEHIRRVAADIDKMWQESNMKINEMEAAGNVWTVKFDRKHSALLEIIHRIELHPEWSDELKQCLVNAVQSMSKE